MSQLNAIKSKVIIRQFTRTETDSGILLGKEDITFRGEVVTVGPGSNTEERDDENNVISTSDKYVATVVKVGDIVIYPKESGQAITVDGEDLYIMHEDAILAVIR